MTIVKRYKCICCETSLAEIERLTKELADLRTSTCAGMLLWAENEQLRKEISIHQAKATNCYSVWSNGQLVKCNGAHRNPYENAQKTTFPVMLRAEDFRSMVEAMEITKAIETLRKGNGRLTVHQSDKLDLPTSIGVCGDWTRLEWRTFRSGTLHAALAAAVAAKSEKSD